MISLVIALYNEEGRLGERLPRLREFLDSLGEPWELILVDDGSKDGTRKALADFALREPRIRVLGGELNRGQGAAVKLGVLASRGDVVVYTDADLPVPLAFARTLIERVRAGADVAFASRWMRGARIQTPQPGLRRRLGKAYYRLIHLLVLDGVHDTNCGLKAYRGEAGRLLFGYVHARRWAFNVEHLWVARRLGLRLEEVPAEWSHQDKSQVRVLRDCLFTLWELACLKWRQAMGRYPGGP